MAILAVVYALLDVARILGKAILDGADMIDNTGNVAKAIIWLNQSGKVNLWDWGQVIIVLVATAIIVLFVMRRGPFRILATMKTAHVVAPTADTASSPQMQHEAEITRAVRGRLKKSEFHAFARTPIGSDGYFLEYAQHDQSNTYLSDTLLIREEDKPVVTEELGRKIRSVSNFVDDKADVYRKVVVILLVYRPLDLQERGSLAGQFEMLKKTDGISVRISFEAWDKNDLDKYGAM